MFHTTSVISAFVLLFAFAACDSGGGVDCNENPTHPDCDPDPDPDPNPEVDLTGSMLYSRAGAFTRYDFDTQTETSVFDGGTHYTVSHDGTEFAWFEYDPSDGEMRVHIHDIQDPSSYQTVTLPTVEVESDLGLAPGADLFGVLLPSPDAEFSRTDLHLYTRDGSASQQLRHIKGYAFTPDGNALVIFVELADENDELRYLVLLIRNYRGDSPEFVIVKEFPDYEQLPEDLAVSPASTTAAYAFLGHIYTLPLEEGAEHHQITTSRFEEWDVHWSPDGEHLALTFGVAATGGRCEDIVIAPVHTNPEPIQVRENQHGEIIPDEAHAPFPLQPNEPPDNDNNGDGVFSCSPGAFWVP